MGAGNKTASWPSANYTSAQSLFPVHTGHGHLLRPPLYPSLHPPISSKWEHAGISHPLRLYLLDKRTNTNTANELITLLRTYEHVRVCAQTWEIHVFERLMQKLQLCISLPVLFHFIPLCPSSRFDDLVYCLLTGFCAFIQKVQLSGWKLFIARAIK